MINCIVLSGYIGYDLELHQSSNNKTYCNNTLYYKLRRKLPNSSEYASGKIKLTFFEQNATRAHSILKKGTFVTVKGTLDYTEYTDNQQIQRTQVNIIVDSFATYNQNQQTQTQQVPTTQNQTQPIPTPQNQTQPIPTQQMVIPQTVMSQTDIKHQTPPNPSNPFENADKPTTHTVLDDVPF